ncbi:stage II sporulation protein M [Candidatus Woesearchaeota archaeon]|nr:stage II sporulation protein M [Candidatus Woesearchaeota archaeon]
MLESVLKIDKISKRHLFAFVLGFMYTFIGALTSYLLFKDFMSTATLFFTTLLTVPTLTSYIKKEERIESLAGLKHFFRNHKDIIETYIFLFLGVFIAYIILAAGAYNSSLLEYQTSFLEKRGVNSELVESVPESSFGAFMYILDKNLLVCVIAFLLSIAYGAGAIFLIIFNASIFATFIVKITQYVTTSITHTAALTGSLMVHTVPELSGFLLAAISGGVISKALVTEKIGSNAFKNVIKDATMLFLLSLLIITIAAFLEIYVTRGLLRLII